MTPAADYIAPEPRVDGKAATIYGQGHEWVTLGRLDFGDPFAYRTRWTTYRSAASTMLGARVGSPVYSDMGAWVLPVVVLGREGRARSR
jgi:hypothetical protein